MELFDADEIPRKKACFIQSHSLGILYSLRWEQQCILMSLI